MISKTLDSFSFKTISQTMVAQVILGMMLMTICSNIQIPLKPVPITLQTVGVLFIGIMYSPRNAFITLASWIVVGAMGAPVFADFVGGMAKILGPTGGYILSWPITAYVVSSLQQNLLKDKLPLMTLNILIGTCIIYVIGVSWLRFFVGSFEQALNLGLYPFILPGLIKAAILSICLYSLKKSLRLKKKG